MSFEMLALWSVDVRGLMGQHCGGCKGVRKVSCQRYRKSISLVRNCEVVSVAVASICGRVGRLTSRSNKPRRPGKVWSLSGLSSDEGEVMKVWFGSDPKVFSGECSPFLRRNYSERV